MNLTIGQTIKTIRTKLGISQLELEEKLGLSANSLTKIESDKVVPKRETLLKIIDELNLNPFESFQLLGLSTSKITEVIDLVNELNLIENKEEVSQKAVNEIPKKLGLLGASMHLLNEDKLQIVTFTQSWYTELLLRIMPFDYKDFFVSMRKDKDNLMIQSLEFNKIIYGNDLFQFAKPFISSKICKLLEKTANVKSILCVPMVVKEIRVGTIIYVKNNIMDFQDEIPLLQSFTTSVGTRIYNLSE